MRRTLIFPSFLVCLLLFMVNTFCVMAQNNGTQQVYRHTVQAGETLYHLAKAYGVSQEQILDSNPGLTAQSLQAGAEILIPVSSGTGETSGKTMTTHKVEGKETLWSISQKYGISVEELVAANPGMEEVGYKLKKGETIFIPNIKGKGSPSDGHSQQAIGFRQLNLAVMLPFQAAGAESTRSVEFYRGFLMAAEELKNKGVDITISAVNEPAGNVEIDSILSALKRRGVQMIIGPLYPTHFDDMASFCSQHGIKCVVPFSSKVDQVASTPELFLLNAPESSKVKLAARLFTSVFKADDTKVVILPSAEFNEKAFVSELKQKLSQSGFPVTELEQSYTVSQMVGQLEKGKRTLFVPGGSTRASAINVLNQIVQLQKHNAKASIALFAYPEWLELANEFQNDFFAANTYFFTNAFYNPYDSATKSFEARYKKWFHEPLQNLYPRLALLGFDAGIYLMEGLRQFGADFGGQSVAVNGYQSHLHFEHTGCSRGGFVNSSMLFIHYGPDRTIEKLAFQ